MKEYKIVRQQTKPLGNNDAEFKTELNKYAP